MRRLPKFVKLIFATVMTLGMYTGVAYGGDGTPPEITVQPESQRNVYGANVEFSITATGENLKYQWQYKPRIKGGTWTNSTDSGATTNTLKLVANDQNEYLYRCLVSDDTYSGDKAIMSNAASLYVLDDQIFEIKYVSETPTAPVITTQPLSQTLAVGDKATFTVEATGTDLTYQWQYKSSLTNSAWTNLTRNDGTGFDTNTFTTTTLTGSQDHYQYRCLVRSKDYYYGDENAKESDSATLQVTSKGYIDIQYINEEYEIVEQPASQSVYTGATVKFRVDTTGSTNLTYRWLYKAPGTNTTWTEVPDSMGKGAKTAELTISPVKEEYENYQFRCSVGGEYYKYEEAKLSSIATLLILSETQIADVQFDNSKLMITEWNVSGDAGLTITLPASGTDLNITVDWGDGTAIETITTEFPTHTYAQAGVYEIAVAGECPVWGYTNYIAPTSGDTNYYTYTQYLSKVKQFGELNATRYGFANCINLNEVSGENLTTENTLKNVTSMENMFRECNNLSVFDATKFDVSKIRNMMYVFCGCNSITELDLSTWDTSNATDMRYMFCGCVNLKQLKLNGKFNTQNVQRMNAIFSECRNLTSLDLSGFNTSNVISFDSMFANCIGLAELDVSNFDTHNADSMSWMFSSCKGLKTLDLSNFDTSNVKRMGAMFRGCGAESINLSSFNTSNVTDMNEMFSMCEVKSLDLSNFNTSNVTSMKLMFYICSVNTLDLSNFDTSKVKDMTQMFNWSNVETLDIRNFDTSSLVTTTNENGEIRTGLNNFTTGPSKLKSILIGDKFVVPEGTQGVFQSDKPLAIITTGTTPVGNQFKGTLPETATLYVPNGSEEAYKATLSGDTALSQIKPIIEPVGETDMTLKLGEEYTEQGCTVAGFTEADSKYYTCYGYTLTQEGTVDTSKEGTYKVKYTLTKDGTEASTGVRNVDVVDKSKYMITEWNVSGDVGLTITLPVSGTGLNITVDWGDGTENETITTEYPTHKYAQAGVYEIAVAGNCQNWGKSNMMADDLANAPAEDSKYYTYTKYLTRVKQFGELNAQIYRFAWCENLLEVFGEKLVTDKTFKNVTDMSCMFYCTPSLIILDVSEFDTSNVTDMKRMFATNSSNLMSLNLSKFDTSNVISMTHMFTGCSNLTSLNLSSFNTSNVISMADMFWNCTSLNEIDLSSFNTSKVTTMQSMFSYCRNLVTLDLSNFDTSSANTMRYMFLNCQNLTDINLSGFDTSNVTDMGYMFYECESVKKLELNNFDTSSVTNIEGMFSGCKSIKELDLSSFDTSKVNNMHGMFAMASQLSSLDIANFDTSNVEDAKAMFKNCSNLRSIQISNKFVIPESENSYMFEGVSNLTAIITTSPIPVANQFKGMLPETATLYVPNGSEDAYRTTLSGDTSSSKIKPIIEPIGESSVRVVQGSEYIDEGCTVAGFTGVDSIYYTCYGYGINSTSDVDTTTTGNYKVRYSLTKDGTDFSNAERDVEVLEMPSVPTNFKASDATSADKINLTWETNGMAETTKCKLEYLDDTGAWKKLSDNATSPYIHSGLSSNKAYEYRISAVTKDGVQSKFAYAIGRTAYDELEIIIRNDNIAPIIEFVEMTPKAEYIASNNTIKIKFKAEDINYKYEESDIKAEDIVIKVGGIVNSDAIKKITKLKTTNGEEYELELSNVTGVGKLELVIPKDKIVDKAGNKNIETTLDIPTFVANGGISDTKPTVTVDENEITIINNQTSIAEIVKIEYQYRISGDTEFTTIPNGASGDTATSNILKDALADTYYEIRTVVEDSTGNKKESKTATVKTSSLDSSLISISATPTTLTSGDVTATITYNSKFHKEYSTDGTNYISLTNGNTKELIIKANLTIYARLTDGKNYSDVVTYEVNNIDKERPVIGKIEVSPSGKSNSKQIIATDVKDVGVSGIKGYYISKTADLDNPTWVSFEGTSFAYTIKENGTYYVWVSDNVGNISEAEIVIATGIVSGVGNITYNEEIEISVGETAKIEITYTGEAMSEAYSSSNSSIVKVEKNIRQIEGISVGVVNVVVVIKDYDGTEHQVIIKVTVKPTELQAKLMSDGVDYNGEWTNKDVNAILTTNGTKPFEYKEKESKNGAWTKPENVSADSITGLTTITYSGDYSGEKYYIGMNKDGNIVTSEAGAFVVRLDKTAPTIGAAKKTPGTNSIDVAIIGATDNLSGIKEYEIGIYKDNVCLGTYKGASGEATFIQLSSSTTYQIKYKITDNAGNETDMIDGGSETTGIIRKVVTYDYVTNGGTSVSLASEERIAGTMIDLTVTATKPGYNFKGWSKTPSGDVLTSLVMPEEDITLYAIFKDEDAPKVEDKSYETVDGELDIILKPSDDGSGIGGYAVTTDDGTPNKWEMKEPDADGFVRITVPGTNKYYVWVKDLEGNFVRYEQIAIKDIFAPTGKIEVKENIVNDLPYANRNEVNLKITAEDNESKPEDIKIAIYNEEEYKNIKSYTSINFAYNYVDGGLETKHQTTPGDGLKRIYVIFKDKAGNISMTIKQLP